MDDLQTVPSPSARATRLVRQWRGADRRGARVAAGAARRRRLALLALLTLLAPSTWAAAQHAGMQRHTLIGDRADAPFIPAALYYPTAVPARPVVMGPFTVRAALDAPAETPVKALIILSHGTGGSELGHTSLAEALARADYLVAALRHPGDNWQDRSLLRRPGGGYFRERPGHVVHAIDAVLALPAWRGRIGSDARGPKIGAVGHSAGGYTVLALAGGRPDVSLLAQHCAANRSEDPVFCSVASAAAGENVPAGPADPGTSDLRDPRLRAVVAMAPVGAVFDAASLAAITIPGLVVVAGKDGFLAPRFHGERIAAAAPQLRLERVPDAGHFAFMTVPGMPVPTEDGDAGADPPGFDRAPFLARLGATLVAFFDEVFR